MKIVSSTLACVLGMVFNSNFTRAGDFHFDISDVTPSQSQAFQKQMIEDRKKLDQFFKKNGWPTFEGKIRVIVFDYSPPLPHSQEFEWTFGPYKGMFVIPARRVKEDKVVTIHEMTHIYAPNQGKMLTEGFAVYVQQLPNIGRLDVMPTFGKSLRENLKGCTKGLVNLRILDRESVPGIGKLADVIHPPQGCRIIELSILRYLVAGSFVEFLVENYGLDKFKALYDSTPMIPFTLTSLDGDRYQRFFGKSIENLQKEWEAWVEAA
jgi:hypothetical protein